MPPELGGKWRTECLNIRFPMPTLLCAGFSVKLILISFLPIYFSRKYTYISVSSLSCLVVYSQLRKSAYDITFKIRYFFIYEFNSPSLSCTFFLYYLTILVIWWYLIIAPDPVYHHRSYRCITGPSAGDRCAF